MATNTKLQKIQAFNATHAGGTAPEPNNQPEKLDPQLSNSEQVKAKAEQKPKTQEEIDAENEQAQADQLHTLHQLTDATSNIIDQINAKVDPAKNWLASQPTPGGIAGLLIFIFFIALVAIPVNAQGQTRAYLFWQSLLGRTHMKYRENLSTGQQVHGSSADFGNTVTRGASADFGNTVTPTPQIDLSHLDLFKFT